MEVLLLWQPNIHSIMTVRNLRRYKYTQNTRLFKLASVDDTEVCEAIAASGRNTVRSEGHVSRSHKRSNTPSTVYGCDVQYQAVSVDALPVRCRIFSRT